MSLLSHHHEEERPWGSFEEFTLNESSTVKILRVSAGKRLSLQRHKHRDEYWRILEGSGTAQLNDEIREVGPGDTVEIHAGDLHRISGGENGMTWLEISFGEFDENDIERTEDDFGRN